ncbi:uncharacterized protein CXorf38-like isoform X1 [Myxocyprinus asiaticus]|uniref:uncharacterized protein CXorf38-like isoform X1 n=1 Tax=Myxocyprinus asiaticus TaxID=70543 RepID=UPI0022239D3C|nr:uncharacterized protein CXorf38-like isoform X1 [Myxocyprinus asiaticus]
MDAQLYNRLRDEEYRNWLKTQQCLSVLRSRIRNFVDKETGTFHRTLLNNPALTERNCNDEVCYTRTKKDSLCKSCIEGWRREILTYHTAQKTYSKGFDACQWPTNKWEVAKVFMPSGHKNHSKLDQFDVSAILNLMRFCKHFSSFIPCQFLENVVQVRNALMHSPDFKLTTEEMNMHVEKVMTLVKTLQTHVPELNGFEEEMKQLNNNLDEIFSQTSQSADDKKEDIKNCEIEAVKEMIGALLLCFEENLDEGNEEEKLQPVKKVLDFLKRNKDLQENLSPQVKEMQDKVDQHEQQISVLEKRVDKLEKTQVPVSEAVPVESEASSGAATQSAQTPAVTMTIKASKGGTVKAPVISGGVYNGPVTFN